MKETRKGTLRSLFLPVSAEKNEKEKKKMLASVDTALTFPSFCSPKCEIECLPERMREDGIERVRQKERGRVGETEKRNGEKRICTKLREKSNIT